jgi:hypothetical protein
VRLIEISHHSRSSRGRLFHVQASVQHHPSPITTRHLTPRGARLCLNTSEKLPTTIGELAARINTPIASKEDVPALDKKIQALDKKVTEGFESVENLLRVEQKREIEDLKTHIKKLEDALAVGIDDAKVHLERFAIQ